MVYRRELVLFIPHKTASFKFIDKGQEKKWKIYLYVYLYIYLCVYIYTTTSCISYRFIFLLCFVLPTFPLIKIHAYV